MNPEVILVNNQDEEIGRCEKLQAHREGLCHRAYSIFIFSEDNPKQILLHKRNHLKYHSGNKWTNTCCSHPQPGETLQESAHKRLQYEMGIKVQTFEHAGTHLYKHAFENGLIEHELDHILVGFIKKYRPIAPNPEEATATLWSSVNDVDSWLSRAPDDWSAWFEATWNIAKKHIIAYTQ